MVGLKLNLVSVGSYVLVAGVNGTLRDSRMAFFLLEATFLS